jgi:serine/threonine protein kinase
MGNAKSSKKKAEAKGAEAKDEGAGDEGEEGGRDRTWSSQVAETCDRNKCSLDDFVMLKTVGKGSFGKVIQVRHKEQDKIYAMKVLKKDHVVRRKQVEHTRTERRILEEVDHPYDEEREGGREGGCGGENARRECDCDWTRWCVVGVVVVVVLVHVQSDTRMMKEMKEMKGDTKRAKRAKRDAIRHAIRPHLCS